METFPAYARPQFGNFVINRATAVIRTSMESGPAKQTKVKSRVLVSITTDVDFSSRADYQRFIAWYSVDLNYGADWFNWTDPVDHVVKPARIVNLLNQEVPLVPMLDRWRISMVLETWSA